MSLSPHNTEYPAPFEQAGILVHGRDKKWVTRQADGKRMQVSDKHQLIAPYTQGRYYQPYLQSNMQQQEQWDVVDRNKYFGIPKTAILPGEDVFDAALRQLYNHTHINGRVLLGEENMARLKAGAVLENVPSPAYDGVTIIRMNPTPRRFTYLDRHSRQVTVALFDIEIDGIEKLQAKLKNAANRDVSVEDSPRQSTVETTVEDRIFSGDVKGRPSNYPKFQTYLNWLRAGAIPPDGLELDYESRNAEHKTKYQNLDGASFATLDALPGFTKSSPDHSTWFAELEARYAPDGIIANRDDWEKFRDALRAVEPRDDYNRLKLCTRAIAEYGKGTGMVGDDTIVQIEDLNYYQRGAEMVPFKHYLQHGLIMADINDSYAKSFAGKCDAQRNMPLAKQLRHSQLGIMAAYAPEKDIDRAVGGFWHHLSRRENYGHIERIPNEYKVALPLKDLGKAQRSERSTWLSRIRNEEGATPPSATGRTGR